jgi:hypothetical protein
LGRFGSDFWSGLTLWSGWILVWFNPVARLDFWSGLTQWSDWILVWSNPVVWLDFWSGLTQWSGWIFGLVISRILFGVNQSDTFGGQSAKRTQR